MGRKHNKSVKLTKVRKSVKNKLKKARAAKLKVSENTPNLEPETSKEQTEPSCRKRLFDSSEISDKFDNNELAEPETSKEQTESSCRKRLFDSSEISDKFDNNELAEPGTSKEQTESSCRKRIFDSSEISDKFDNNELANVIKDNAVQNISGERRFVDIFYFFNELKAFEHHPLFSCSMANLNINSEQRDGFCSNFTIKCNMCQNTKQIRSEGTKEMDINTAVVLGTTSIGCGFSQLEEFTSICNIPCMTNKSYTAYENELAEHIHNVAWNSMEEAGKEESEIAREEGNIDADGYPLITVIADGAWSKRSYNVNYDSASGVGCIVGYRTGKILYIGIKNKYCCVCSRAESKKIEVKEHRCFKNWNKSSGSMEAEIILEGFNQSIDMHGVKYAYLVGDGDSSVTRKLQEHRPYGFNPIVHKIECTNHLLRNYCSKLRTLTQKKVSSKKQNIPVIQRNLLNNNIKRLRNAVVCAVNKRNSMEISFSQKVQLLKKDILNSIHHVFGDHDNCENYYCKGSKSGEKNRIFEFKDSGLYEEIILCLNRVASNSESLIRNMTNNAAEHYNSIVAKFVGAKRINFSLKGSYQMRCEAAAITYNLKSNYYRSLYKSISAVSPGKHVKKYAMKKDAKRMNNKKNRKNRIKRSKQVCQLQNFDYGEDASGTPDMVPEIYEKMKKNLLDELSVSEEQIIKIERETVGQSSNQKWIQQRSKRLTASWFGRICKQKKTTSCAKLISEIWYTKFFGNEATEYGTKNEHVAKLKFSKETNVKIEESGLFIDKKCSFLAASPDGIIGKDGLIEIKCPFSAKDLTPEDAIRKKKITWASIENSNLKLKRNHNYYFQVQGQLHIADRNYCYFVIWTPLGMLTEKISRDENFWMNNMDHKLTEFFMKGMLPEIVDPRHTRNLPIRSFTKSNK